MYRAQIIDEIRECNPSRDPVRASASLCYAKIPGDSELNMDQRVYDLLQLKLAKRRSGRSTAQPLTNKPLEVVELDQVDYLNQLRDRHL